MRTSGIVSSSDRIRRSTARWVAVAIVLPCLFGVFACSANAATGIRTFVGASGTQGGEFRSTGGIAINQAGTGGVGAGDVYVVDESSNRVQEFDAEGSFVRAFGIDVGGPGQDTCTTAAACVAAKASESAGGMSNPQGIAIEQSTGNVYVSDYANRRIDVFSATGVFEGAFGWAVDAEAPAQTLQFCTTSTGCQAGSEGSGAGQFALATNSAVIGDLAFDSDDGLLFSSSPANRRIDEFSPTLAGTVVTGVTFVRGFGWGALNGGNELQVCTVTCHAPASSAGTGFGQFGEEQPLHLAVGENDTILVSDTTSSRATGGIPRARVLKFSPGGVPSGEFAPGEFGVVEEEGRFIELVGAYALATNQSNGNALVVRDASLVELDGSGNLLQTYLEDLNLTLRNSRVANDEASGVIYLTLAFDNSKGETVKGFATLGETVAPAASIDPVTSFGQGPTGVSAAFEGEVNPEGLETGYHFEYSRDGAHWTKVPSSDLFLPSDEEGHPVGPVTATGLEGSSEYRVKLVASKIFNSGSASAETTFTTPAAPPIIGGAVARNVADSSAGLAVSINPQNQVTRYHFECVTEAQFAASGFAEAVVVPSGAEPSVEGAEPVVVEARADGLTPRTTYHCRPVAANGTGSAIGGEAVFTTFPPQAGGLPDDRAYEQASPVQKNGNNIQGETDAVEAAAAGGKITFFSNGGLPGGEGAQEFPVYLATRAIDGSGWGSQGLLPPASTGPEPFGKVIGWDGELRSAYNVNGMPGGTPTIYQRDTASAHLTPIATGTTLKKAPYAFAGESRSGSLVLFEDSVDALTGDAAAGTSNAYIWNKETGALQLASVMNNGKAPSNGAFAGPYRWFDQPSTNEGGAASLYYTQAEHALSEDGNTVFFTEKGTGQVYARVNQFARQSNTSKGRCTQLERACTIEMSAPEEGVTDPNGEQPAVFIGATPSGSQAFLLSSGKLTADATTGATDKGTDLYRYDTATRKLSDLTVDASSPNGAEVKGVVGFSDDGSYVYFVANGALAKGAKPGTCVGSGEAVQGVCNLYVWHEGTITFVSEVQPPSVGSVEKPVDSDVMDWAPGAHRGGTGGGVAMATGRVSADGQTLLFRSKRQLTSYDNVGFNEIYRFTVGKGLGCVSCSPIGGSPTGEASLQSFRQILVGPKVQFGVLTRNLSANGNRVFFNTPDQLVAGDGNEVGDVYEWEASGEGSCQSEAQNGGCLFLISTGTSPEPSFFGDAAANGQDIFFFTSQPLVAQDKDELADVYDARVGGGIAAQNAVESICEGEGCKPGATTAPGGSPVAAPMPGGNVKPTKAPVCKKGKKKVKRHGRTVCVKKKHPKHHKKRSSHGRHKKAKHGKGKKGRKHPAGGRRVG